MNIPENLKYTKNHEWIRIQGSEGYIGITEFAQSELGDIVFIEVETIGETLQKGDVFGTIEAVKTVSDIFLPVTAEILEVNEKITDQPELINNDPYGDGWIVKIKLLKDDESSELLDNSEYKKIIEQ